VVKTIRIEEMDEIDSAWPSLRG